MIALKSFQMLQQLDSCDAEVRPPGYKIIEIEVEKLRSGKFQPRKNFLDKELKELSDSIRAQGIIQPIIVRTLQGNSYEIIAGERRWRAAKLAGLLTVPAIIKDIDDMTASAFALIENIQSEDLNVIEEAKAYEVFYNKFKMTHEEIASSVGKSRASVSNFLRLLKLPDEILVLLGDKKLDMGHARCLLSLEHEEQLELSKQIIDKNLTVRQAEKIVRKVTQQKEISDIKEPTTETFLFNMNGRLKNNSKYNASIKLINPGKGRLVVDFSSEVELEELIRILEDS